MYKRIKKVFLIKGGDNKMHVFFVTLLNLPTVAQARLQYVFFKK